MYIYDAWHVRIAVDTLYIQFFFYLNQFLYFRMTKFMSNWALQLHFTIKFIQSINESSRNESATKTMELCTFFRQFSAHISFWAHCRYVFANLLPFHCHVMHINLNTRIVSQNFLKFTRTCLHHELWIILIPTIVHYLSKTKTNSKL